MLTCRFLGVFLTTNTHLKDFNMRTKLKRVLLFTDKLERFQHKLSESYSQVRDLPLHKEVFSFSMPVAWIVPKTHSV